MKKEDSSTKKILAMLTSEDEEMALLGVRLALGKGREWCKNYITGYGPGRTYDLMKSSLRACTMYVRANIAIYIDPLHYIDVRDLTDFSYNNYIKGEKVVYYD